MNSIVKRVFFILIFIFLFSNVLIGISNNQDDSPIETVTLYDYNGKDPIQLTQSTSWFFIGTTILIDNNWKEIRDSYDWCHGEGTEIDPYIIENITIDALGSDNCIKIQNSEDYFIVRNCVLYNAGSTFEAAISLNNVSNGKIINNYCINNVHGLLLWNCTSISISGNTVSNNNHNGIIIIFSNNTIIMNNVVSNNIYAGIYLYWSANNTVSGNIANYNQDGIVLWTYCRYNKILNNIVNENEKGITVGFFNFNNKVSGNSINYNEYSGIFLGENDHNNTITENTIGYSRVGLIMWFSENNTIAGNIMSNCGFVLKGTLHEIGSHIITTTNLIDNKPVYYYVNEIGLSSINFTNAGQIILVNCNNSFISGHNLSFCSVGIYLGYSHNNLILENIVTNNRCGIDLFFSDNNTITDNTVDFNDVNYLSNNGINLYESDLNTISENNVNHNNFIGIQLSDSHDNVIIGNIVVNNDNFGLYIIGHRNLIADNYVDGNGYFGIVLGYGDNNTIFGNIVKNHPEYGLHIYESNNNMIFLNTFINNGLNALDDGGTNNKWDNGRIGNYWDDYQGIDLNLDGFGDIPYSIPGTSGSQDNFPRGNNIFQPLVIYILLIVIIGTICLFFFRNLLKKKLVFQKRI